MFGNVLGLGLPDSRMLLFGCHTHLQNGLGSVLIECVPQSTTCQKCVPCMLGEPSPR